MARLIISTQPLTGHVQPMLPLARRLVERGHHVRWYGGRKFVASITATGAMFEEMRLAPDWDDARVEEMLPALRGKRGLARAKAQVTEMCIAPMCEQLRDLEASYEAMPFDAVIGDSTHLGAAAFAEKHGVPWVGVGVSPLVLPSVDTAPFGSGRPPAGEPRWVHRLLNWLIFRVAFRAINRLYRARRRSAGLPDIDGTYFDVLARDLFLQPTIPAFEYPRSDLPPQVRFIGPLVGRASEAELPPWWPDVDDARARGVPIVLVTQGTLATNPRELITPTVKALAEENVLVIVTSRASLGEAGLAAWPANVRATPYLPYQAILPHAACVVTNGGYGGVQHALSFGVPLVVAGGSEDKPEVAARVRWSGAGVDLETGHPSQGAIAQAVHQVLNDRRFRERARAIAGEMERYDAPALGALAIEELLAARGIRTATASQPTPLPRALQP